LVARNDLHRYMERALLRGHVWMWHIASFRCDAQFSRYRGIADIARIGVRATRSLMTQSGHGEQFQVQS
jgi:hypothetical protein